MDEEANEDAVVQGLRLRGIDVLTTTEAGGTAQFTINLATVPTQDVTINLSNSKPGEASLSVPSQSITIPLTEQ